MEVLATPGVVVVSVGSPEIFNEPFFFLETGGSQGGGGGGGGGGGVSHFGGGGGGHLGGAGLHWEVLIMSNSGFPFRRLVWVPASCLSWSFDFVVFVFVLKI